MSPLCQSFKSLPENSVCHTDLLVFLGLITFMTKTNTGLRMKGLGTEIPPQLFVHMGANPTCAKPSLLIKVLRKQTYSKPSLISSGVIPR